MGINKNYPNYTKVPTIGRNVIAPMSDETIANNTNASLRRIEKNKKKG